MHYEVKIHCPEEFQELLIAELMISDFDSFSQNDHSISAYIDKDKFDETGLKDILSRHSIDENSFEVSVLEEKNWNEEWEKNFDPVTVDDQIIIKADFHKVDQKYPYEIRINPKMSFGTGHHETTYLMLKGMLEFDLSGKKVLDAGTGTGILAIMAAKLGSNDITATDIDDWSIENSEENFKLNKLSDVKLIKGEIDQIQLDKKFDFIIANINRNVLLHDIPYYSNLLEKDGVLLLSGFYDKDISILTVACEKHDLNSKNCHLKNNWACLTFQKSS